MMEATDRNSVLVAHLSAECARLGEAEMMRLARRPAADHAGLRCDELAMLLVAESDRFGRHATTRSLCGVGSQCRGVERTMNGSPFAADGFSAIAVSGSASTGELSLPEDSSTIADSFSRKLASTRSASCSVSVFLAGRFA